MPAETSEVEHIASLEHVSTERKKAAEQALEDEANTLLERSHRWARPSQELIADHQNNSETYLAARLQKYPPDVLAFREAVMAPMTEDAVKTGVLLAREAANTLLEQPNADELLLKMFAGEPGAETMNRQIVTIINRLVDEDVPEEKRVMAREMLVSFMYAHTPTDLILDYAGNSERLVKSVKDAFENAATPDTTFNRDELQKLYRDGMAIHVARRIVDSIQRTVVNDDYGKEIIRQTLERNALEKDQPEASAEPSADIAVNEAQKHIKERRSRILSAVQTLQSLITNLRSSET